MSEEIRSEGTPVDRLTRLCDAMTQTLEVHPEYRKGDKCMVFLDDGERGGIVAHGYKNDKEAIIDLLSHLRAMFKANGMELEFMRIPDSPQGIDGL